MKEHDWRPTCRRPEGLVHPVRPDPKGIDGPTWGQARGRRWRQCAPGWYVAAEVDGDVVEQRILEQSVRVRDRGAVTGWSALRWRGARFFDGTDQGGRRTLPVPLLVNRGCPRPDPRIAPSWEQIAPSEQVTVAGVPCTSVQRALFDEMRRTGSIRQAVRSMDMAAAAGLISVGLMSMYVEQRCAWYRVPLVRDALALAVDDSRSPPESDLRLVWCLDADLPRPLCNRPLFGVDGTLLGYPDLFDPDVGLVGEYDGADHLLDDRRRHDTSREEAMRDHGLEYFRVVKGELATPDLVAGRMLRARRRAARLPPGRQRWTLDEPPWFTHDEPLHQRLVRLGLADELTHT